MLFSMGGGGAIIRGGLVMGAGGGVLDWKIWTKRGGHEKIAEKYAS